MTFERPVRIRFSHCDPAGIVFFPQYLVMTNALVEDWFNESLGIDYSAMIRTRRVGLPIVKLEDVVQFERNGSPPPEPLCLVVEVDNRRAALLVDSLIGQQQLVVKSLETNLHAVPGIAGATILGDGRVALILDVNSIVRTNAARVRSAA